MNLVGLGVPYGALVLMGYPYAFEEIVIVDLPSEEIGEEAYQDGQTNSSSYNHDDLVPLPAP